MLLTRSRGVITATGTSLVQMQLVLLTPVDQGVVYGVSSGSCKELDYVKHMVDI